MRRPTYVLVTGSRIWTNPVPVIIALNEVWASTVDFDGAGPLFVMDGDCKTGPDRYAAAWSTVARFPGTRRMRRPAHWSRHDESCGRPGNRYCRTPVGDTCRGAGFRRNGQMVDEIAAADRDAWCLAFIRDGSAGATDCADRARAAGLQVVEFGWEDWPVQLESFSETLRNA